jgi:hypothetical protein
MASLKKIGVIRTATFMGLYGVFAGIILDIFGIMISLVLSTSPIQDMTGLALGTLGFLIYPIAIGVVSFIGALIFIPLVNLVLKITGGVGLKIQLGDQIY